MIPKNQNFLQNYINAAGAEDANTVKQVVFGEIANLIYDDPAQVQQLLLKHAVVSSQNRNELTNKLTEALSKDEKLGIALAKMLGQKSQKSEYYSANKAQSVGTFIQNNPELVNKVGKGIVNLFGGKKRRQANAAAQAKATQDAAQAQQQYLMQQQDAANKIKEIMAVKRKALMPKIFIGAAIAIVLITGTILLINRFKK